MNEYLAKQLIKEMNEMKIELIDVDTIELLDQLKDEKNTEEEWTEKVALQTALEKLDKREKTIIKMRYFEGKTQTEISSEVGLSQAQVSRIEKVALLSMRKKLSYS